VSNALHGLPPRFRREATLAGIGAVVPYIYPSYAWAASLYNVVLAARHYPAQELIAPLVSGLSLFCAPLAFLCFFAAIYLMAGAGCSTSQVRRLAGLAVVLIAASATAMAMRGFQILSTNPGHAGVLEQQLAIDLPLCLCWALLSGAFATFADPLARRFTTVAAIATLFFNVIYLLWMTVGIMGNWTAIGVADVGIVRMAVGAIQILGSLMVTVFFFHLVRVRPTD